MSFRLRCECEFCRSGKATTHNDPSHDQSLHGSYTLPQLELELTGGSTKCARVVSDLIQNSLSTLFTGKAVLELGAGTGLVSLVISIVASPGRVFASDQGPVLETLRENIEQNSGYVKGQSPVEVVELYWGSEPDALLKSQVDVLVGSDLIFAKENIPLLLKTFDEFSQPKGQAREILFAHIDRFSWEESFFKGMEALGFSCELIEENVDIKIFMFRRTLT